MFCYERKLIYASYQELIYVSDQKFEKPLDLLLVIDENKSHYVYIKDFNRSMFHKKKKQKKKKTENTFEKVVYSVLVLKMC